MHHEVDAEVVAVEHHPHRVDEEWDVVGDEHQNRPLGPPTVTVGLRGQDPHEHLARVTHPTEHQVRDRGGVRIVEATIVGVLVGQFAVVPHQEVGQDVVVRSPLVGHLGQRGERLGDLGVCAHVSSEPDASSGPVNRWESTRAPRGSRDVWRCAYAARKSGGRFSR